MANRLSFYGSALLLRPLLLIGVLPAHSVQAREARQQLEQAA